MNTKTIALIGALTLAACGGGGGSSSPARVNLETLSGFITGPGGTALPGVTIHFEGRESVTDASGVFLLAVDAQLPPGTFLVEIDGSTTTAVGSYPHLEVAIELDAGDTAASLPQVITLPDLSTPEAANQSVAVSAAGATLDPISLTGPDGDIGLDGPMGTVVTVGGQPAAVGVDFNVTPVPPSEVPMPLPEGLVASSFVTIQPGGGTFAVPGGGGLDVRLPNDAQLPIGTMVDVWSFDHDVGDWVNRSDETGQRGTVVDIGAGFTAVDASGVITEGGWHAPAIPIDPACATTITGQVCDLTGAPAPGLSIATSLGQFATTDASGVFTLPLVPAYDLQDPNCAPVGLDVEVVSAPIFGQVVATTLTVGAGQIVQGGVTQLPKTDLDLPQQGCVSGFLQGELENPAAGIAIDGPTQVTVFPSASGNFHACQLDPGSYTATATLAGQAMPTVTPFEVTANMVATITITAEIVTGSGDVNVTVRRQVLNGQGATIAGAIVFLQGTDPTSAGGIQRIANGAGVASFNDVTGPFTVTAWSETPFNAGGASFVIREATTAVGVNPPASGGTQNITLALLADFTGGGPGGGGPTLDAIISGDILGNAANCPVRVDITTRGTTGESGISDRVEGLITSYSFDVPSGQIADISITRMCPGGNTDVTEGGVITGIAALTAGENRTVDIDIAGPSIVPFDEMTTVTFGNDQAMGSTERTGEIELFDPTVATELSIDLFDVTGGPAPTTWDVPETTSGPLANFQVFASYSANGTSLTTTSGTTQYEQLRLGGVIPQAIAFNLLEVPTLTSPGLPLTTSQPEAETFVFNWPTPQLDLDGFDQVTLSSTSIGGTGSGTTSFWNVYLEAGSTGLQLPPLADVILENGEVSVNMFSFRLDEDIDYQASFGPQGTGFPVTFGQNGTTNPFLDVTRILQSSNGFTFEFN